MPLLLSAQFFQNKLFQKILLGTLSECQTVRIQIGTDVMSVLVWVQTVYKIYQQMTKVAASKERVRVAIIIPENVQHMIMKHFKFCEFPVAVSL